MDTKKSIGILDLQGGVVEHYHHFKALGIEAVLVKRTDQLSMLSGLVIPGGESTCLSRLLDIFGFIEPIKESFSKGMKIWGTCAGAILIAKQLLDGEAHLKLMDIEVQRNAFGSQVDSFHKISIIPEVSDEPLRLTFIRAPKILAVGKEVKTLLEVDDFIAAAEDDHCLATVFHPELSPSLDFHNYFAKKCGIESPKLSLVQPLKRTSWMKYARVCEPSVGSLR